MLLSASPYEVSINTVQFSMSEPVVLSDHADEAIEVFL